MFRVVSLGIVAAPLLLGVMASTSYAVAAPADFDPVKADVSCVAQNQKASKNDLDAFLSNPQKLLMDNPGGGLGLSNSVMVLASSSSSAYASIMGLVNGASDPQKSAIGAGLARAFGKCKDSQPDYAQKIEGDVADMKGSNLFLAYAGANKDNVVASVNAAGASSSALGGGETEGDSSQKSGSNSRRFGANDPYANTTPTISTNPIGFVDDGDVSP